MDFCLLKQRMFANEPIDVSILNNQGVGIGHSEG